MKFVHFLFLAFTLFIISCTNKTSDSDKGMARFAGDKNFQAAHESPLPLTYKPKGTMVTFKTPDGKTGKAYSLKNPKAIYTLLIIHEWWGLNDYVKRESDNYFSKLSNVNILALDLYDGKVTTDPELANKYVSEINNDRARSIIKGALNYYGKSMNYGTLGWCFGGGWSLNASIIAGDKSKACVIFYGMPELQADKLLPLEAPVLGLFAEKDQWINPEVVQRFEDVMKATGKNVTIREFKADHGFANPSNPKFNQPEAQAANALALEFLKEKLVNRTTKIIK